MQVRGMRQSYGSDAPPDKCNRSQRALIRRPQLRQRRSEAATVRSISAAVWAAQRKFDSKGAVRSRRPARAWRQSILQRGAVGGLGSA